MSFELFNTLTQASKLSHPRSFQFSSFKWTLHYWGLSFHPTLCIYIYTYLMAVLIQYNLTIFQYWACQEQIWSSVNWLTVTFMHLADGCSRILFAIVLYRSNGFKSALSRFLRVGLSSAFPSFISPYLSDPLFWSTKTCFDPNPAILFTCASLWRQGRTGCLWASWEMVTWLYRMPTTVKTLLCWNVLREDYSIGGSSFIQVSFI